MDDHVFEDGLLWLSEKSPCICGYMFCSNVWRRDTAVCVTHSTLEEKTAMHDALQSKDCTQVCQLLEKGISLCTEEHDNCFIHIMMNWRWHPFLVTALQLEPSAVNCRGPEGDSLLMMCDSVEEMKTLLQFGPDLDARNNAGDNILHNAVRNRIFETFHKIMDLEDDLYSLQDDFKGRYDVLSLLASSKMMLETICKFGVDINSLDSSGKTALQIVLEHFKCGYTFAQFHFQRVNAVEHISSPCYLGNEIAAHALNQLLKLKPTLPPADDFGRTALMKAALSPWNVENMKILIQLGEEVRAKDHNGYNTIFYLLSSLAQHNLLGCNVLYDKCFEIDRMTAKLLDLGCELQGTDILIIFDDSSFKVDSSYKVVVFLMALRDSELNLRTFPQKLLLKNDPRYLSFLNVLLQNRTFFFGDEEVDEYNPEKDWDESDISVISEEISAGIKTNQILEPFEGSLEEQEWRKKLKVTGAIQILLLHMMNTSSFLVDPEVDYFPVLAGILRLLLPFWPSPPLALILALECDVTSEFIDVSLCRRLLEVLHDVGGPLPLGSTLFVAMEEKLEVVDAADPDGSQGIMERFNELHEDVPSLQHLCRAALRSNFNLEATDTNGLDLTSLRVNWFDTMLPLPQLIKNYVNYHPLNFTPLAKGTID